MGGLFEFVLSFIPAPWLAFLKRLPWRLIGWCALAVAVVWFILMVNGWRVDSNRLEATEKALAMSTEALRICATEAQARQDAFTEAATKAKQTEAADRAAAERTEHDLQVKLAAADASGRDLARRLRDYQSRRCSSPVPGPASTPGQPATAPGEPGDSAGVDAALDAHLAACDRDAIRLTGWQEWWTQVQANR